MAWGSRKKVKASRAGNGAAAASEFIRPAGGPPSHPKQEPSAPNPRNDMGYDPYTKNLYSSNEPEKKKEPQPFRGSSPGGGADWSNQEPGRKGIDAI